MDSLISTIKTIVHGNKRIVIMGDFNQDYPSAVTQVIEADGFYQLIDTVTTDYGSCLDHIYINFPSDSSCVYGTLESHYSDHKPIFFSFDR